MSFSIQVHLNISSLEPPNRSSTDSIFFSVCIVSASIPPSMTSPLDKVPIWPETYITPLTIVASEKG